MQFQSDILQVCINRSPIEEASALGAVLMGGFALKRWTEFDEAVALRTINDYIKPNMPRTKVDTLYGGWKKAVQRALFK